MLTVRCGFVQFRHFGYVMRNTGGRLFKKSQAGEGAITPAQAVSTALAGTVGTGNIVGTAQAIAMGGCGAVFWLWLAALLGMAVKYAEVTLSIKFRQRDENGDQVGGPMYYISKGMGKKWGWLAASFALLALPASFGIGNMSQVNSIVGSVAASMSLFLPLSRRDEYFLRWILGIALALLVAFILLGGIKRIGSLAEKLVPFMALCYISMCIIVLICHAQKLPHSLALILRSAFEPQAIGGGASGILLKETVAWGMRRSAFSNEAGLGSAAIAHAAAEAASPVDQGIYGIFEVFMDSIVLCTLTALTIICSGTHISFGTMPGSELVAAAFATVLGQKAARLFVAAVLTLFAFTTVLGWALYGARCTQFLFGTKAIRTYQLLFSLVIVMGCVSPIDLVWDISDTFNGLMAIPNFIALFALSGLAGRLTKAYFSQEGHGGKKDSSLIL